LYAGNLAGFFQHEPRIYTGIVPTNTEEQMRPGGAARRADVAQEMALLDLVAHCDLYVGQMKVHADETVAVIDEHGVSLEEHLFGHHHRSFSDRQDWTANRGWVVNSGVALRG
jgi:hypothetical protein